MIGRLPSRLVSNTHHLPRYETRRLYAELPAAHVEQVLHARAKQLNDENIVETFRTEVVDLRYADYAPVPPWDQRGGTETGD